MPKARGAFRYSSNLLCQPDEISGRFICPFCTRLISRLADFHVMFRLMLSIARPRPFVKTIRSPMSFLTRIISFPTSIYLWNWWPRISFLYPLESDSIIEIRRIINDDFFKKKYLKFVYTYIIFILFLRFSRLKIRCMYKNLVHIDV